MRIISLTFLIFIYTISAFAEDKLVFAIDLIRHGDRTPLHALPALPHEWKEGEGQLTPKGMEQEYQLGVKFRQKYVDKYKLLPPTYQPGTLYVRSTDVDRTLMSAQSLLLGLYPVGTGPLKGYQPIPIHTKQQESDELIPYRLDFKKSKHQLYNKYSYIQKDWLAKKESVKHHFGRWSKITGDNIEDLNSLIKIGDTIYICQVHQKPLPPDLSEQDAQEIINAGRFALAGLYKPKQVGCTAGYELLATVSDYIQQASMKKTPLKYVLLSGHDSSIMTLLSAMHAPLDYPPPYASHVNIALFENTSGGYNVVVSYNDKPVNIPHCGEVACSINQFADLAVNAKKYQDKLLDI